MDSHKDKLQLIDTLRSLNRIFVKTRNSEKLISELCSTLVTINEVSSVWIALVTRTRDVEYFAHSGLGALGKDLESKLFSEGLNYCSFFAIEQGIPSFIEKNKEICENCPLLKYDNEVKVFSLPVYFQKRLLGVVTISLNSETKLSKLEESILSEFTDNLGNAINTIQLEEGKQVLTEMINRLTKSISGNSSKEVINSFMQNLIVSLESDYAFIGRLIPGYNDRIRTISVATPDGIIENFEYTLKGTPCETVINKDLCCHVHGVANLFPEDIMLRDMGIEAYIGTPLLDSKGTTIGIMVVLKKTPFKSETLARYVFQVFSSRGSSELMRYDNEQRIIESESQYQDLIESSKNPIYIIVGTKFALVNSAWLQMFEYTEEEVRSPDFSIHRIVRPESLELIQQRLDNFISGISQPFRYELQAISKSGKEYELDVSVTHLNWKGKRAVQGVYRNITSEKRKEKILVKNLKLAEESASMKTSFLSKLSQEVYSNLISINQRALDIINDNDGIISTSEFAQYIVQNTSTMLEHVNDVKDISGIELGRMKLNPEKFNLSDLLKDIIDDFKSVADKKDNVIVCCKKKYQKAIITADPLRTRQILVNLISNAIKYTEKGKISIDYVVRHDDVRISISDTGIGITPEKIRIIHKSFIDPNGKFMADYDGSGLGLALTRSLIELMGGKIWVEPNSGGGSIFYITIPLS